MLLTGINYYIIAIHNGMAPIKIDSRSILKIIYKTTVHSEVHEVVGL